VTESGTAFFAAWGLDLAQGRRQRRVFCRPCIDWTERRPHLAGYVGAQLAGRCFALGWIERVRDSRAVAVTQRGREGFAEAFGFESRAAAALALPGAPRAA